MLEYKFTTFVFHHTKYSCEGGRWNVGMIWLANLRMLTSVHILIKVLFGALCNLPAHK